MPKISFCKKMCSMAVMFGSEVLEVSSNLILDFVFALFPFSLQGALI